MDPNRLRYLASLSKELHAQASRVRDLIGSKHWLSDGNHKEAVLAGVLERHLPSSLLLRRGFVVSADEAEVSSGEQDLLLIDARHEGPCFDQAGLAMCFARSLVASCEVKSTLSKGPFTDALSHLLDVGDAMGAASAGALPWLGIYVFDGGPKKPLEVLPGWIREVFSGNPPREIGLAHERQRVFPAAAVCGPDLLFRFDSNPAQGVTMTAYQGENQATAAFLSLLLDAISTRLGGESRFLDFFESGETMTRVFGPEPV